MAADECVFGQARPKVHHQLPQAKLRCRRVRNGREAAMLSVIMPQLSAMCSAAVVANVAEFESIARLHAFVSLEEACG